MDEWVRFGSRDYVLLLLLLLFARAMDFLSTWVATPNLVLEANPLARKLGWTWGIPVNVGLCGLFALWPLPAVIIITTSILVAARNFQFAWLMRSYGEENYRDWFLSRLEETRPILFLSCLFAQTALTALVGGALMYFASGWLVPFGVGTGIVAYAVAVAVYTVIALRRSRHTFRSQ